VTRAAVDVFVAEIAERRAHGGRAVILLRAAEGAAVRGLVALRAERFAERLAFALVALGLAEAAAARGARRARDALCTARRKTAARVGGRILAELLLQIDVLFAASGCERDGHECERAQLHGSSTPMRSA
jgi:hypothetical protein